MSKKRQAETAASINNQIIDEVIPCLSATNAIASPSTASTSTKVDAPTLAPDTMMENGSDNAPAANVAAPLMPSIPVAVMAPSPTMINEPTLPALAKQINIEFNKIDADIIALHDHRIEVGMLLKMAQDRMPERGAFMTWCKANVKRGKSDIYRCLALVKSDDPVAAHEAVKAADRERKAAAKPVEIIPEKDNSGTKALAAINASQPAPSNSVWNEPAAQMRDKEISAKATALAGLKSYALAEAVVTQIRLLRGSDWASVPSARRLIVIDEIRKLIAELEPKE